VIFFPSHLIICVVQTTSSQGCVVCINTFYFDIENI